MTTEETLDSTDTSELCHVCGVGDDGRRLCHFLPNDECPEEIFLHVFCGKTAAILPHVNRPDLEILTKAGVKNKHGTGVSVTLALQRCRSSRVNDPSNREQEYYLSKEFERIYLAVTKEPAHADGDDDHDDEHAQNLNLEDLTNLPSQTVPNPMYGTTGTTATTAENGTYGGQTAVSGDGSNSTHHHHHHHVNGEGVVSPENGDAPPSKRHKGDDDLVATETLETSPYDIEMERLQLVCDQCSGVGYSLVRGVARTPPVPVLDEEGNPTTTTIDEDDDDDNFDPTKCSQEQVDHVRVIVITKERQDRMEEMSKLILGEQHGQEMMTFSTSFSYQVINAWNAFTVRYHESSNQKKEQFDLLYGFTDTLKEHETWMHDHEVGWGGEKMVKQLALLWKIVLKNNNEELGIDSEYTRPGIVALLEQFKEAVESVEAPDEEDEKMMFEVS
jgi:hypothetical protein